MTEFFRLRLEVATATIRPCQRSLVVAALASCLGCNSAITPPPRTMNGRPLPTYSAGDAQVFDDTVQGSAVGLATPPTHPRLDLALRTRAQRADVVARFRVSTLTSDSVGQQLMYHITLEAIGQPLARRNFEGDKVELNIPASSPSFGIFRTFDTKLIGWTFMGFIKRYMGPEDVEVHWHLDPDTADVYSATRDTTAIAEFSSR